jgi:MFS superfamily sulfate permease-like transporter
MKAEYRMPVPKEQSMLKNFKYDIPAGLVVFLVALPLCLGIALASGAPLFSGIITGIVGGIIVGIYSKSPLSVSGPAAGLTVIVLSAINQLQSFEGFLVAVVLAGVIQIIFGFIRAGIIGYYFPSSVIKGMLAAIGLILILKQIPHALGYDFDYEGDFSFINNGHNTFSDIFLAFKNFNIGAIIISLFSLIFLIIWNSNYLSRYKIPKIIPGALIVVIIGITFNLFFQNFAPNLYLSPDHLVVLPVISDLTGLKSLITFPDFSFLTNTDTYVIAMTLALVASLESLLSVEATDKLDPFKRNTPTNRELKAQGIGNIVSGLLGGIPLTAVIVRSSANINAGARTRLSSIIHGFFLLFSVVLFSGILNMIPLACLAAILLVIGYKLASVKLMKSMYKNGWNQFLPFMVTIIAILFTDLLKGIGIGMVVSIFYILRNNYKTPYYFKAEEIYSGKRITITLAEEVSFLNKGSILLMLEKLPENSEVTIDGSRSINIDFDIIEIIENFKNNTSLLKNIRLELINIKRLDPSII